MKLETNLPSHIHSFKYVKNSHYLKLTDNGGNSTKLSAKDIIQYTCATCHISFWMGENIASACPSCRSTKLKTDWVELQLSFIPEDESQFKKPKQKCEDTDE